MEQVGGGTLPFFMALAEGFFNLPLPENYYYINMYLYIKVCSILLKPNTEIEPVPVKNIRNHRHINYLGHKNSGHQKLIQILLSFHNFLFSLDPLCLD